MADAALLGRPRARGDHANDRPRTAQHYWAFLSYSHTDTAVADWLHQSLEGFRVPPALVGRLTDMGPVPSRLTPIFRDRHELAASGDLSNEIEDALAGSRFLIVLCSPAAARSRWTNQEITCFKKLHPSGCILAAIVDGEPFASDIAGREDECFPPALRVRYDRRGRPTATRAEPIAADLREDRDGRRLGLLKIVAGMLGLGLDDLVQREAHRRHKRLLWLSGASVTGMIAAAGLALVAVQARDDARDQRREAESLIGFMLGDLRTRLEPLGRLDVLDAVGERALRYYGKQDRGGLTEDSLAQRSKALTLIGEMANARGDLDGALARYGEAMASTAELVRREPTDAARLFDHAQNVFWVGYIDWQRGRTEQAARAFREYRHLADRMIALAPGNRDYRLERVYADTNLGAVLLENRRYREAGQAYQQSLEASEQLVAAAPGNLDYQKQLATALAYLSDAREYAGDLDEAFALRRRQLGLLASLWRTSNGDAEIKRQELAARRALSRLLAARGEVGEALAESARAADSAQFLQRTEADNMEWLQTSTMAKIEHGELALAAGRTAEASGMIGAACAQAGTLLQRNRNVASWRTLHGRCLEARSALALKAGSADEALGHAQAALALARTEQRPIDRALATARRQYALGNAFAAAGRGDAARAAFRQSVEAWPQGIEYTPHELAQRAMMLRSAARNPAAIDQKLAAIGYSHPDYRKR